MAARKGSSRMDSEYHNFSLILRSVARQRSRQMHAVHCDAKPLIACKATAARLKERNRIQQDQQRLPFHGIRTICLHRMESISSYSPQSFETSCACRDIVLSLRPKNKDATPTLQTPDMTDWTTCCPSFQPLCAVTVSGSNNGRNHDNPSLGIAPCR
jgi:hypothetical protein